MWTILLICYRILLLVLCFLLFGGVACGIFCSWPGIEPTPHCNAEKVFVHLTAREVPQYNLLPSLAQN